MLIAGTIQAKAQCDCDPILTGGETVITASDIVTAFSGASSVSGGIYQVTTDLTINTNFTITGSARFSVDPGVSIIVAPGYTLTITGSSILTAADDEMWAGIEVQTSILVPGKVVIQGGSTIANAVTGVFLNNNLAYYADCSISGDAFFCNNHIGIYSNNYFYDHPASIEQTVFCGSDLIEPYSGEFGTGVMVENVLAPTGNFSIGNGAAFNLVTCNEFYGLLTGIHIEKSTVTVQNNYIHDLNVPGAERGTGVLARGDLNYLILVARVGEAGVTSNKFKDCERGIDIGDYMNSEIHGNRLVNTGIGGTSSIMREGIYVDNCGLGLNYHNITENYLANVNQVAIDLRNMGVATTIVSGNKVLNAITTTAGTIRRGISVRNIVPATTPITIFDNEIYNVNNGIGALNVTDHLMILGNQIEVVFAGATEPATGILAENCSNVLIDVYDPAASAIPNTITGTCSSDCEDQIIGIDIQSSTDFRCYRNIVNDCYPGIRAEGYCLGGNFVCNDLNDCTWGFGLKNFGGITGTGVDIELGIGADREIFGGYFFGGSTEIPSDNAWTPSTGSTSTWANRTYAYDNGGGAGETIGPDLLWYYRDPLAILDMEPASTLNTDDGSSTAIPTGSLINTSGVDIDVVPRCSFPMPRLEEEEEGGESFMPSESLFANTDSIYYSKMITDYAEKLTSGSLENPRQHLYEMGAYRLLQIYPDVYWEPEATSMVQVFLEGNTTSGFFQVIDSIHTGAYETASTLLSAITPGSIAEENYLFVLDTYLIGIDSTGHFTLSEELEPEVRSLAEQHTLIAGEAVHIARAMLDTVVEFDGEGIEELRLVKEEDEALTVYPVPANDLLYVSNLSVDQGTMLVYDLSGRIVLSYHFSTDNPVHHLALRSIESGVYLLVVLDQTGKQVGETSFSKK